MGQVKEVAEEIFESNVCSTIKAGSLPLFIYLLLKSGYPVITKSEVQQILQRTIKIKCLRL